MTVRSGRRETDGLSDRAQAETIVLARESRGLTQTALARQLRVTQGLVSKVENGVKPASAELVKKIAAALDYPESLFYRCINYRNLPVVHFRKRKRLGATDKRRITAIMNLRCNAVRMLLNSVEIPEYRLAHSGGLNAHRRAADVAMEVRCALNLPAGPVENLTRTLEDAGIVIMFCKFGTFDVDALSVYSPADDLPPVVLLNPLYPGDRLRWSLAHEFGHILMHYDVPVPTDSCEEEANAFAAELLMPAADIKRYLSSQHLRLDSLAALKRRWRVAMSALVMRAADLNRISATQKRRFMIEFGAAGYRRSEPVEVEREQPSLIREMTEDHVSELDYTLDTLPDVVGLPVREIETEMLGRQEPHLRLA